MFFDDWLGLGRAAVTGATAYVGLIVLLRLTGKRTLSKLNAFDLVVTVALGSILATALLSKAVPLLEGLTGFAVLAVLQLAVTWLSVRSAAVPAVGSLRADAVVRPGRVPPPVDAGRAGHRERGVPGRPGERHRGHGAGRGGGPRVRRQRLSVVTSGTDAGSAMSGVAGVGSAG